MNSTTDSQLISLLERYLENENASNCLKAVKGEEVRFDRTATCAPLKEVIDIYKTRERINAKLNNGIIKGYDTLLPALENADVTSVSIHSLELLDRWYVAFTNDAISELYGVLDCPKKKSTWFNPETGYD